MSVIESYRRGRKAVSGTAAAAALVVAVGVAFVRYRPARVAIEGVSMAPTLLPDDWVLVVSPEHYDHDDVVVVEHPHRPGYEIVKRLVGLPGDRMRERSLGSDEFWIEGDFAQSSTDSRQFGPVGRAQLKAKVVLIYWPLERRRLVR
ncbi:MAG TPA: S26 family signal peptidase [Actinomycetota bacterium]|nr:S26 family signal peptidase [Actinomycetota bacterium]